jgi:hypothetical protein
MVLKLNNKLKSHKQPRFCAGPRALYSCEYICKNNKKKNEHQIKKKLSKHIFFIKLSPKSNNNKQNKTHADETIPNRRIFLLNNPESTYFSSQQSRNDVFFFSISLSKKFKISKKSKKRVKKRQKKVEKSEIKARNRLRAFV